MFNIFSESIEKKFSKKHFLSWLLYFGYEILQCGDVENLIKKRIHLDDSPLYYVTLEDTFDAIKRAHVATGHGGRDRMIKEQKLKYVNITTKIPEMPKEKEETYNKRCCCTSHTYQGVFI